MKWQEFQNLFTLEESKHLASVFLTLNKRHALHVATWATSKLQQAAEKAGHKSVAATAYQTWMCLGTEERNQTSLFAVTEHYLRRRVNPGELPNIH